MSRTPQWQVDPSGNFNSDLHRLHTLIDVICEIQFDLLAEEKDARVDDLLWIAREMAQDLVAHDDENHASRHTKGGVA